MKPLERTRQEGKRNNLTSKFVSEGEDEDGMLDYESLKVFELAQNDLVECLEPVLTLSIHVDETSWELGVRVETLPVPLIFI